MSRRSAIVIAGAGAATVAASAFSITYFGRTDTSNEAVIEPTPTATSTRATSDQLSSARPRKHITVSVSLDAATPMSHYAAQLRRIRRHGGGVVLVILDYLESETGHTFTRIPLHRVEEWFALADSIGVQVVMIKPHIVTSTIGDNFYRGSYQPESVEDFFESWRLELEHFARMCSRHNVPYLSLTSEQRWQTEAEHYSKWVRVVDAVRAAGSPKLLLTAAFTTLELLLLAEYWLPQNVRHMSELLDVYGINSWIRLTSKTDPNLISKAELDAAWSRSADGDPHLPRILEVSRALKKPYFVTEVGVRPRADGLAYMAGGTVPSGPTNFRVQGLLFQSVFDTLMAPDECLGVSIWHANEPYEYFDIANPDLFPGELAIRAAVTKRSPQTK